MTKSGKISSGPTLPMFRLWDIASLTSLEKKLPERLLFTVGDHSNSVTSCGVFLAKQLSSFGNRLLQSHHGAMEFAVIGP